MAPFLAVSGWQLVIDTAAVSLPDKESSFFKWQKAKSCTIRLIPTVYWLCGSLKIIKKDLTILTPNDKMIN
jgi:hypothetical protein